MSRKCFLTLMLAAMPLVSLMADEQKRVTLDEASGPEVEVALEGCKVRLSLQEVKENGKAMVNVELVNVSDGLGLMLFDADYGEKILKKKPMKIVFDKNYGGSKGSRSVSGFEKSTSIADLASGEKMSFVLPGQDGYESVCTFPLYRISYKTNSKGKVKKRVILEYTAVELKVKVLLKPSQTYLDLEEACRSLEDELKDVRFCNNPRHTPSLEEQKNVYRSRIDSLANEIDSIIDAHRGIWFSTDRKYKAFDSLRQSLAEIDLDAKEEDCGKHTVVHRCRYCGMSQRDIYNRMDDIHQQIYISSDWAAEKQKVSGELNAMYKCLQQRREWKRGGEYKARIIRLYNDIKEL